LKAWQAGVILLAIFLVALVIACGGGGKGGTSPSPELTAKSGGSVGTAVATPPPATVKLTGAGNTVKQVGHTLDGSYRVDYAFAYFCGMAEFLKANGSDGAELMDSINECDANAGKKVAGSTVVQLHMVTMVKVSNTKGNWSLTFSFLG
jgi:hypothetical protein